MDNYFLERGVLISIIMFFVGGGVIYWFTGKEEINPMLGTWVMVSGVYYSPSGHPGVESPGSSKQMKVINDTHFTTLWQDSVSEEHKGFNGGKYTYQNGIYTEYLEYFTETGRIGDTAHFKVEINNNTLSISACDANGVVSETGYFQTWQRLE